MYHHERENTRVDLYIDSETRLYVYNTTDRTPRDVRSRNPGRPADRTRDGTDERTDGHEMCA